MMIGALAVATSVAGCATTWVRPGGESSDLGHDNELGRDDVECQFEASKPTSSAGMEGAAAEQKRAELEALCMQARGGLGIATGSPVKLPGDGEGPSQSHCRSGMIETATRATNQKVAARLARLTTGVFHWRSNTQPTNAAHPANITTSIDCPPCRARCVRCHA